MVGCVCCDWPADDTSVWCPCDETVADPEVRPEESVVRAEKTPKHVFVSKTVRNLQPLSFTSERWFRSLNGNLLLPSGDLDRDVLALRQEDPLWENRHEVQEVQSHGSSGV